MEDFLKNAANIATSTSSGGFHSTEKTTWCQQQDKPVEQVADNKQSFCKQSPLDVDNSGCEEAGQQRDFRQHRRRGSNSVTKDSGLDFPHLQECSAASNSVFETRVNNEQSRKNSKSKSDSSRSRSLGDVVEPLNAERLRPIRQKTRNAVVSILDDGEVCLEFFHHKNGEDKVVEVLRISQNGMKITVYQPNGKSGVPLTLCPPAPLPGCESSYYLFSNLPSKYWKKYQYATRFVHLVRKKTPKVNKQSHLMTVSTSRVFVLFFVCLFVCFLVFFHRI